MVPVVIVASLSCLCTPWYIILSVAGIEIETVLFRSHRKTSHE
jgi:hypothetical protein